MILECEMKDAFGRKFYVIVWGLKIVIKNSRLIKIYRELGFLGRWTINGKKYNVLV